MLELAILGLLLESPMHGYELRKRLTGLLGAFRAFSYGSLYPTLRRMQADGLIQEQGADGLVALKFPHLEPLKLDIEYTGFEVEIGGKLEASDGKETLLVDVRLKDFSVKPIEGGSAQITFKAQLQADLEELSEVVDWWMVEGVVLTLTPPKNQAAANDAAHDSGAGPADTLAAQDKADAEKEAKRRSCSETTTRSASPSAGCGPTSSPPPRRAPPAVRRSPVPGPP